MLCVSAAVAWRATDRALRFETAPAPSFEEFEETPKSIYARVVKVAASPRSLARHRRGFLLARPRGEARKSSAGPSGLLCGNDAPLSEQLHVEQILRPTSSSLVFEERGESNRGHPHIDLDSVAPSFGERNSVDGVQDIDAERLDALTPSVRKRPGMAR